MKKYLISFLIIFGFAAPAFALPYYQSTQSLLPFTDSVYNIGTSSPSNLRYNGFFNNLTVSGTCTGCGGGSGTISTSSPLVAGQGVFATGASTIASVATSTPSTGGPITYSGTFGSFFGGVSGAFGCTAASGAANGCLSSTDWTTFNNKQYAFSTSTLTASSPLTGSFIQVGSSGSLGIQAASGSQNGYLSSADYSLLHTATTTATYPLQYTGSTNAFSLAFGTTTSNTWSALQLFNGAASTTQFSVFSKSYFGATATTTIDSAGNIVIPSSSNLTITGKSDGCATFATGQLNSTGTACGSGGGGSGSVGTSTADTINQVAFFGSTNATPALIGGSSNFTFATSTGLLNLTGKLNIATTSSTAFNVQDQFGTNRLTVNTASSSGSTVPSIFLVQASSTTDTLFSIDDYGHLMASSTKAAPTVTCAPSGGTIIAGSNDTAGEITTGTLSTSCTVTFGSPFSATPLVFVQQTGTASILGISAQSTTAFTISLGTAATGDSIQYFAIMP